MVRGLDLEPQQDAGTRRPAGIAWPTIVRTALPLIFVSLLVGFALDMSGLSPLGLWRGLLDWFVQSWIDLFGHLPSLGAAFLKIGSWLLMGAAIAVPVWLIVILSRRMLGRP
jgi:hypothetical protein